MNMNSTINAVKYIDGTLMRKMIALGAHELRENAEQINNLNVFPVPDGDTGDNMRMTLEGGLSSIGELSSDALDDIMKSLSHGMLLGARGNSGVILSQFFSGIAKGLEGCEMADVHLLGKAFERGSTQAYSAVVTPKEGTILTVAREATQYACSRINGDSNINSFFDDLVSEMHVSLMKTPELLPILKEAGVIDSGGAGLFNIMNGFLKAVNGDENIDDISAYSFSEPTKSSKKSEIDIDAFSSESEITYGYCTELLLRLQTSKVDLATFDHSVITQFLMSIGNSVVIFRDDSIIKIHVHTLTPEKVLEFCHGFGEFLTLKIENMQIQHSSEKSSDKLDVRSLHDDTESGSSVKSYTKKYGSVSVCNGEGIEEVFYELGVDKVINGGATQNPSTQDFLDAFNEISAENIFVMPNNGNILLAAKQAASIYTKSNIIVIETLNIGHGYAALPYIDEDEDNIDSIISRIDEAIHNVKEGEITTSVRDTELFGCKISKDDSIAILGNKIIFSDNDRKSAIKELLSEMLSDDTITLTAFFGSESKEDEIEIINGIIENEYPDIEFYPIEGKQPVYPYIFIAE